MTPDSTTKKDTCAKKVAALKLLAMSIQHLFIQHRVRRSALAKSLGITPGAVSQWVRVPAERVVEVERATGIPREELRPDLFAPAHAREETAA